MAEKASTATLRSLRRYQVMAIVTGTFLLLVTIGMIVKYGFGVTNPTVKSVTGVIAMTHGFIYLVYLVSSADLWSRARWSLVRLVVLILGGVVPGLSFWLERRVTRDLAGSTAT